jgi:lipopolysaccharide/colanic/teichoic acid biosynthesis glycosyltransferase
MLDAPQAPKLLTDVYYEALEAALLGRLDRRVYLTFKRGFDITAGLVLLVCSLPLWLAAALAIRLTSGGPVLFRQTRCGLDGKEFTCYKFRTMVNGAHARRHEVLHLNELSGPVFKVRKDPRATRLGRFLRTTSIDELPQLLNVIKGDMSIVGPRPPLPEEAAQYNPQDAVRLSVKPGLTCLWQVSGRSNIGFERWMELDREYILRRGFLFDLVIILRTIPALITCRGAV